MHGEREEGDVHHVEKHDGERGVRIQSDSVRLVAAWREAAVWRMRVPHERLIRNQTNNAAWIYKGCQMEGEDDR